MTMTGADHYQVASRLMTEAAEIAHAGERVTYWQTETVASRVAAAQVHATLAVAFATEKSNRLLQHG